MKQAPTHNFYGFFVILYISIGIGTPFAQEKDDFFSIKNSNAIRDSLNLIKFVNPNEAERFAFEILEKYPDKKPNRVRASTYAALGQIYHIKGLTGPTLEYFDQSERLFEQAMGSVPPWLQISIGNVYYAEGFFDKAQDSYNESFRNFLKLSDIDDKILNPRGRSDKLQGMAVSKNNLAMIAEEKKEYSAAENLYKEALSYRLERQQYDDLAHSYLHLAQLYLKSNELDQVSIYCDSSEMMVDELFKSDKEQFGAFEENVNRYKGMSNQYKAQLNFKLGNKALMQTYLNRANKFYAALPIERARLLEISASMHHELGEFKKALQEIDAGLEIAQSQGLTREEEVLYTSKKRVLSSMGNTEGVVGINEILLQMNQKKVTAQNRDLLINMELREQLRSRQEALEKIQQERRQFIVLGLVAGVISILIIFTVRTQFITAEQQKQLAEQSKLVAELELKSTERELRFVSTSIMEKNEMIETIKKDINYASQYLSDSDSKYLLNPLRTKLDDATSGLSDWEEFQKHFNKTYPGFLEQLASLNRSLTIPDLRLCAYLRAGQTTKEIANMTGLSVRSIESRRYRLRKKLDLDRDVSLHEFIQQIKLVNAPAPEAV